MLPLASRQAARWYSIQPEAASSSKPVGIDPAKLHITKTSSPKTPSDPKSLVFGREFTGKKPMSTI
jgi:branched-chain amino acid aminotransferase